MNRRTFMKYGFGTIAAGTLGSAPARANAAIQQALAGADSSANHPAIGPKLYEYDLLKWLYIGWENDHPKSWTFMGGGMSPGIAPGVGPAIQYTVTLDGKTYFPDEFSPDRKSQIHWSLRDGYLPCPVSRWQAGPIHVEIQHFANRILEDKLTAVYSRVTMTAHGTAHKVRLNINAGPDLEVPLSGAPTGYSENSMYFDLSLQPGRAVSKDFVTFAAGSPVSPALMQSAGSFDFNYKSMSDYWHGRMAPLAAPVILPVPGMVDMYKSIQIMVWENMVKKGSDYEIHAAPPNPWSSVENYDNAYSHDAPNYIDQYMREGDYELARKMLASKYFKASNTTSWDPFYEDTIGKYILPYAEYLRATGDTAYFTPEIMADLKKATRNIHALRVFDDPVHYGLMRKSQDFENWVDGGDFLLCDNWSALHGLQSYKYICERVGNAEEAKWAGAEMASLNDCVNQAITRTCERLKIDYYLGGFDDITLRRYHDSDYSWVPYSGALSTFPWGAFLKGFDLGGIWKDKFDAAIQHALEGRDQRLIPAGSWGTWWGQVTYGTAYNCSAGLQCLFSDKYRTEVVKNLEFQLANQCVPFNWSEAFEFKGRDQWVGMYVPPRSYGNLDSWGASFTKQALLQSCASVKNDGTVILGRGIPDYWLAPGSVVEWANINVNDNRKINFKITARPSEIELRIWGDVRKGEVHFNLPVFQGNILSADAGKVDNERGVVLLSPTTNSVSVKLRHPPQTKRASNEWVTAPGGIKEKLYPQ